MSPYFWLVRAFRAAVRAEVERALADRRRALEANLAPITPEETARIARFLATRGVETADNLSDDLHGQASADILPFPSAHRRHDPTPPSAA